MMTFCRKRAAAALACPAHIINNACDSCPAAVSHVKIPFMVKNSIFLG